MHNFIKIFVLCFIVSCSDKHELIVELDQDLQGNTNTQIFHFNFNGNITFPNTGFTRKLDLSNDRFEIIKIKYSPIKKWKMLIPAETDPRTVSEWGQQGILVRIIRTGGIFIDEETIFAQKIEHFYNPNISTASSTQLDAIITYTRDLNSGLGNNSINNSTIYSDLDATFKTLFGFESNFYYHSIVVKFHSRIDIKGYYYSDVPIRNDPNDVIFLFDNSDEFKLATLNLSQAAIIFPFDSVRYRELKNF